MNAYELTPTVTSLEAPLMIVNWERYYGEIIYAHLEKEIPTVETTLKEANMWHPHFTPSKVTGMILSADYTLAELYAFATDSNLLGDVALEALDTITAEIPVEKPVAPAPKKPHPVQQLPAVSYMSGAAAKAIRTMQPLFP